MFNSYKGKSLVQMKIHANQQAAEIERLRAAIEEIRQATLTGKVCDDIAWFSDIETLHDFCEATLDPKYYQQSAAE